MPTAIVVSSACRASSRRWSCLQVARRHPAVLITGGMHDVRVPIWLQAKFAARLQATTGSGRPVFLRVERDAGHGIGSTRTQIEEEWADLYAFALSASGVPVAP